MERQFTAGLLRVDKLPAPFVEGKPPWKLTEDSVTLLFGKPENAKNYLEKLFKFAFQIRDGVIYLPGQYPDPPPSLAVRAEMQTALTRTFLQGAKKNIGLDTVTTPYLVDPDGDGVGSLEIEFKKCNWYLHQRAWMALVNVTNGVLLEHPGKVDRKNINFGSLYPGAIKRHDALTESEVLDSIQGLCCATFFLVGCSYARLTSSGDGVLLLPIVENLNDVMRP
jgi:hypothetical protein